MIRCRSYLSFKGGFIIYEKMLSEATRLESEIKFIENQLDKLPSDNLICARNGNHYKWYRTDGTTSTYIPKKNQAFAEQLAIKKYYSLLLNDLHKKEKAIRLFLKYYPSGIGKANELLIKNSGFQSLLQPFFRPVSQELADWENTPYERNPKYPEQLIYKCSPNLFVRSKSEVMIATLLYSNKIPFRYECPLQLGEIICYPDFTIRHPRTGATYFWEHFGMMDKSSYAQNCCSKLQNYMTHGIIPSLQLITTYETQNNPLSPETIKNIIQQYFLQDI